MEKEILYPKAQLAEFKQMGDPFADEVVKELFKTGFNPLRDADYSKFQYNHQAIPSGFPEVLVKYFEAIRNTELDQSVLRAGSLFFQNNAQPIMLCLGLLSLPYCYGAADGAKVLVFSKRIMEQPEKRLLETAEFVLDVCAPNGFEQSGKGFVSIAKVRLIHAAIRYHLLNSNKWNSNWGHPINQKDMAGTNYSFSLIAIRGLRKLGYTPDNVEAENYIRFWNEIGKMLGLEEALRPDSNKEAFILEKKIRSSEFRNSIEGEQLTKALLDYIDRQKTPLPLKGSALAAYLLGDELADILAIETDNNFDLKGPLKLFSKLQSLFSQSDFNQFLANFRQQQKIEKADSNFNLLLSLTD